MEKEKILEVKDLKVSFQTFQGSVQAVRGVSWHLNKKETIAIVGESGCGKTVTIQTVIGLNPKKNGSIKGGEVLFNGQNLLDLTPQQMRKLQGNQLSIIFQDPFTFLNPTMTVGEQIMEPYMQHSLKILATCPGKFSISCTLPSPPRPRRLSATW